MARRDRVGQARLPAPGLPIDHGQSFRVGFDVGGTFTDFVLQASDGRLLTGKRLTTSHDPARASVDGLRELVARAELGWSDLAQAVHGTTLGSNVVIERKGRHVALLTTCGFRDVLVIGREKRYQVYDLFIEKPAPLVPRSRIREVTERIAFDGEVLTPLDEAELRVTVRGLAKEGITTLAVCFLHAYANPTHERRAAQIVREEAPDIAVSLSSEVSPVIREYERTSTTVVNAYVMTAVRDYLERLERALADLGYRGRLFVMQSAGGIATAETMARFPVRMIESGPAAGALMAAAYGKLTGHADLVAFDMGGTTAKLSLVVGGRPQTIREFELHRVRLQPGSGIPMTIPAIDLVEIGAGGGSIARVAMGVITVGPDSAGADPGPICYGAGGSEPTVTDANLVLGYLNPDYFLGGQMRLDVEGARRGIATALAGPLGLTVAEAAWGVHQIVNTNMELATRVVSIERGYDPRRLAFAAFGGSGPVHGCRLAQALRIPRVILPAAAGVTSALGLLAADVKFDLSRSYVTRLGALDAADLGRVLDEMAAAGSAVVREAGVTGPLGVMRNAELRYVGQGYELTVPFPDGPLGALREAFHAAYAQRYGYADPKAEVELVTVGVTVSGAGPDLRLPAHRPGTRQVSEARKPDRPVYFPEFRDYVPCPIYDRGRLPVGARLAGPAVVEEAESTTVLPPRAVAEVDPWANLLVSLES
ncbi:MAG TPA: hydantoinase/oxoprolinase family protein [Methylomirabilota bacterium]|nr:hydantoinase/oxoprolinase family protein [Methylomirabilota bacterium]